ncbi:hypothetical protein [Acinetobacter sp. TGL-Y2]|uniref:hypothetical protein n=1 Tax=Acinetobacter sp. TGL-Y2 TaxID=1407071 RepID=UPI000A894023|nr:hypothetical protein [Acinetobacter sp. TGL-Y2]
MKAFLLNLTTIIEHNAKIYASIIVGIVGCLLLFIAEAVHIQTLIQSLSSESKTVVKAAIEPLIQRYSLSRYFVMIAAVIWSVYEYKTTKKKIGRSC